MCGTKKHRMMHWFSGFFAMPGVMHLIRWIFGISMSINGVECPMNWSLYAVAISAVLSGFCYCMGRFSKASHK